MGLKFAARLASIGLLLVRDLLRYYPRDHVDSAMRRIEALVSGETATIVATIRRCNGCRPRNTNSPSSSSNCRIRRRLKVSRFLAGKRFSSPAYLKVSSVSTPLVPRWPSVVPKDGPYGITFQDP